MSDNSAIEWTQATWNPTTGCAKVSPGCDNCYAIRTAARFQRSPAYAGTVDYGLSGLNWTGTVNSLPGRLDAPLHWRQPRRIFVNSMSDLFHDAMPDEFIAQVFAVMALAPQHTFQVLTKRHGRMRSLLSSPEFPDLVQRAVDARYDDADDQPPVGPWPLGNVWLGVSVETQQWADIRIPALLGTPAAVRWISAEPLLGPVDLSRWLDTPLVCGCGGEPGGATFGCSSQCMQPEPPALDWVVVGGESGSGARPMHPDWVRQMRDQCVNAGVPFFLKQWGSHRWVGHSRWDEATQCWVDDGIEPQRVSKHLAGRKLDGRTWDEYPVAVTAALA